MSAKTKRNLTDPMIGAWQEFSIKGVFWDTEVTGLRLRIGARRLSWNYYTQQRRGGRIQTIFRPLGTWPTVDVAAARKVAKTIAAQVVDGTAGAGKREAVKLQEAWDRYLVHLTDKAAAKGKPPRWHRNVVSYGKIILPKWGTRSLADIANRPGEVADWHKDISKGHGRISANHCARIVRAIYRREARRDITLPARLPTSAVEFNAESASQKGLARADFPKWRAAWDKIESDIRKAYHLAGLLTGCRPGELARLKWADVLPRERCFVIRGAKADNDIRVPLSPAICRALRIARGAAGEPGAFRKIGAAKSGELVFPGCAQVGHRDPLPARGNMLRHTFRTIATDCGVDEMLAHFLMGHSPEGISQRYVVKMMLASGPALREAQRKISRRIMSLLKP